MALPGPFLAGQKLTAGQLNDATQKTIASVDVNVGSDLVTGVTTETTITQLTLGSLDLVGGALYTVHVRLIIEQTVASDEFLLNMRQDTPLTGTLIASWNMWRMIANGTGGAFVSWADFTIPTDQTNTYYFSVDRFSGTGSIKVYGHHTSGTPSGVKIMRSGYASEFSVVT